jgi:hypothetical protein
MRQNGLEQGASDLVARTFRRVKSVRSGADRAGVLRRRNISTFAVAVKNRRSARKCEALLPKRAGFFRVFTQIFMPHSSG